MMILEISQATWLNIDQIIRDEVDLSIRQDSRIYEIVDTNVGRVAFNDARLSGPRTMAWYAAYFDFDVQL